MELLEQISLRDEGGKARSGRASIEDNRKNLTFKRDVRAEEAIRIFVAAKGVLKFADIARRMGLATSTITKYFQLDWVREEVLKKSEALWDLANEELANRNFNFTAEISTLSETALGKMAELMHSEDERVSQKAAADILDRNPDTSKHHKVEATNVTFNMSGEMLQRAAEAAQEIERKTIDAQP